MEINTEALSGELENIIRSSQESIQSTFPYNPDNSSLTEEEANERLEQGLQQFDELYKESYLNVLDKYRDLGSKLSFLRSTFLPIDLIRNVIQNTATTAADEIGFEKDTTIQIEDITSKKFLIESYENTFMRALGLPSDNSIESYIYFDFLKEEFAYSSDKTKLRNILDERQISEIRQFTLNNEIYEISDKSFQDFQDKILGTESGSLSGFSVDGQNVIESTANRSDVQSNTLFSVLTDEGLLDAGDDTYLRRQQELNSDFSINLFFYFTNQLDEIILDPLIENLSNKIYKKSYLFFPPVQDSSIDKCISEPEKFIAKPFSQSTSLKYNGETSKVSLLEAVIRIRLDKLSGYDPEATVSLEENVSKRVLNINDVTGEQTYSFVENLTIDRLSFSLKKLAEKLSDEIEDYFINSDFVKSEVRYNSADNNPEKDNPETKNSTSAKTINNTDLGASLEVSAEVYALIKNIDEVFKVLLSSDKAINIQSDTFRTSSVSTGQFMGIINELVTTPGNVIRKKEEELAQENEIKKGATIDTNVSEISTILGVGRGVGMVDLICFALAMFTIEERFLLGMLDESQFSNLKREYPVFGFFDGFIKPSITSSVEEYTKQVIAGYALFIETLDDEANPSA